MLLQYLLVYIASFIGIFLAVFLLLSAILNRHRMKNPVPTKFPFVSVIIPAYNESENINKTIESACKLDYPNFEVIVIDDGSTDNTYDIAKKYASKNSKVRVFTKKNGGKASAINYALTKAKGEFVATLDADSFVTSSALRKMMGYFNDSRVAAVTPSMKVYRPQNILQKIQQIEYLVGLMYRKIFAFMNMIHVTPGPFSVYRKAFFDRHGGFDENNPTEDTEIALRIQTHHYRIENSVDAVVYTVSPKSMKELTVQRTRWYYGLIKNLEVYTHLFDPKYGYFALMSLPASLISVILMVVLVGYFGYLLLKGFYHAILNFSLINFDFFTFMSGFKWDYVYYWLTDPLTSFLVISFAISLGFVYMAKLMSGEKEGIKTGYLYFIWYYSYLFAFWWVMAIFSRLFGAVKWKGRKY